MKPKEWALLLVPCLVLSGFGLALFQREQQAAATPTNNHLVVKKVRFENLTHAHSPAQTVRVTAWVGHGGALPKWWGKRTWARVQNVRFVSPAGKQYPLQARGFSGGHYEDSSQNYVAGCYLQPRDFPLASYRGTIKATVIIPHPANQLAIAESVQIEVAAGEKSG